MGIARSLRIFAEFLLDIVLREADRPDVVVFKRAKNFFEKFKLLSDNGLRSGDFGGLLGFGRAARNGMSLPWRILLLVVDARFQLSVVRNGNGRNGTAHRRDAEDAEKANGTMGRTTTARQVNGETGRTATTATAQAHRRVAEVAENGLK